MLPSCVKCRAHHSPRRGPAVHAGAGTLGPVTTGALAVVATGPGDAAAAVVELVARGAADTQVQPASARRVLVYGRFDDAGAHRAVTELRSAGWSAVVRPVGGGHLTAWRHHTAP